MIVLPEFSIQSQMHFITEMKGIGLSIWRLLSALILWTFPKIVILFQMQNSCMNYKYKPIFRHSGWKWDISDTTRWKLSRYSALTAMESSLDPSAGTTEGLWTWSRKNPGELRLLRGKRCHQTCRSFCAKLSHLMSDSPMPTFQCCTAKRNFS